MVWQTDTHTPLYTLNISHKIRTSIEAPMEASMSLRVRPDTPREKIIHIATLVGVGLPDQHQHRLTREPRNDNSFFRKLIRLFCHFIILNQGARAVSNTTRRRASGGLWVGAPPALGIEPIGHLAARQVCRVWRVGGRSGSGGDGGGGSVGGDWLTRSPHPSSRLKL